jgi:hypothetical protein
MKAQASDMRDAVDVIGDVRQPMRMGWLALAQWVKLAGNPFPSWKMSRADFISCRCEGTI